MTNEQAEKLIEILTDIRDELVIGGSVYAQLDAIADKLGDVEHKLAMMDITLSGLG